MIQRLRFSHNSRRAFTLVELLVVVAIIAVLLGIMMPSVGRVREQARSTQCAANMRQLLQAASTYSMRYDGVIVPARHLPSGSDQAGWWPSILEAEGILRVPTATDAEVAAGKLAMSEGPLYCPSGENEFFPPNLTNNTSIPADRQDAMGTRACRMRSSRTKRTVDCWYGIVGDRGTSTLKGTPTRAIESSTDVYTRITMIRMPAETVMLYDGLIYHHMQVNANRINARHGDRTQTNLGFFDGHVETVNTARLPGGLGAAKTSDYSVSNVNGKWPKWWLEQR